MTRPSRRNAAFATTAQQGSMPVVRPGGVAVAAGAAETMLQQGSEPSGCTETRIVLKSACTGCPGFSVESSRRSATWNSNVRPVAVSRAVTTPDPATLTIPQHGEAARESAAKPSRNAAIDSAVGIRKLIAFLRDRDARSKVGDLAVLDQRGVALPRDFDGHETDR